MSVRVHRILAHLAPAPTGMRVQSHSVPAATGMHTHATAAAASPPAPAPATVATADLCDSHANEVALLPFQWRSFGQLRSCHGPVVTLLVHEDNGLVRAQLEQPGLGRVLLVDGGGSMRCALVGDQLGALAVKNGWAGVVVVGAVRDSAALGTMPVCILALGTSPVKSVRRGGGTLGVPLALGLQASGAMVHPGDYLYADEDGVLITKKPLHGK